MQSLLELALTQGMGWNISEQLKGLLTVIAKASHHKTFIEICLSKGDAQEPWSLEINITH